MSDIDETIRQTRTSIFELRGPLGPETGTVRTRLLAVTTEVSVLLGFTPHVRFSGPVDAVVPEDVVDDLIAVLRESLTNVARHADARKAEVDLRVTPGQLCLDVADDGAGMGTDPRRSGLANLRRRAEDRHGSLIITSGRTPEEPLSGEQPDDGTAEAQPPEGTHLRWMIPLG